MQLGLAAILSILPVETALLCLASQEPRAAEQGRLPTAPALFSAVIINLKKIGSILCVERHTNAPVRSDLPTSADAVNRASHQAYTSFILYVPRSPRRKKVPRSPRRVPVCRKYRSMGIAQRSSTTMKTFQRFFVVRSTPGNKLSRTDTQDSETCAGVGFVAAQVGLAQNFGRRGKRGGEREGKE